MAGSKHIIDVKHPDSSAADSSSRPILVTNRPIMKDPMVVEEAESQETSGKPSKSTKKGLLGKGSVKSKSLILTAPELPPETEIPAETETEKDEEFKPDEDLAEEKPTEPKEKDESEEGEDETELEQQKQPDQNIQKLAESNQHLLPINAVEKRRSKNFMILGILLSIILIIVLVDIALDAGLIKISGVKPVTHFFSN